MKNTTISANAAYVGTAFNLLSLSSPEFDEDELEAELDALGDELELEEQEKLDEQLLDVGPAVPSGLPEVCILHSL